MAPIDKDLIDEKFLIKMKKIGLIIITKSFSKLKNL